MVMRYRFTLPGKPATKKTSNRMVYGRNGRARILPSSRYELWFTEAMGYAPAIRRLLVKHGADLPFRVPVRVGAVFFTTSRQRGDLLGYQQALADWMQEPAWKQKRNGAGIIADDRLIKRWADDTRVERDDIKPRIEVVIEVL